MYNGGLAHHLEPISTYTDVWLTYILCVTPTKLMADYATPILRVGDPETKKVFPGQGIQPNERQRLGYKI